MFSQTLQRYVSILYSYFIKGSEGEAKKCVVVSHTTDEKEEGRNEGGDAREQNEIRAIKRQK